MFFLLSIYLILFFAGDNTLSLDYSKASYVSLKNQVERENSLALVKIEESTVWYLVSYVWKYNNVANQICIPLRISVIKGQYKIDYITPEWNGMETNMEITY